MKETIIIASTISFLLLFSCKEKGRGSVDMDQFPIVTVNENTLYKADIETIIPKGLPKEDSTKYASTYIDMWIGEQLMYDKAQQNITNKDEINTLVENYRKSLISNTYQEQLLKQQLSQSISENELKTFYEQNKDKIKLEDNIIKGLFLKIPVESSQLKNFEKWYKQGTSDAIENIEKNTLQNAVAYEYFYDRWVDFDDIMDNIPSDIADRGQFLKTNKNVEAKDSAFVYLVNIKEYKLGGDEAPYEYIKTQLKEIFVEHRKADFLKQVQKDLYEKAIAEDEIKFYNK